MHLPTSQVGLPCPAARLARWHETLAKFDLSVLYVPGKDNTVADCLRRSGYQAGKAWMDISVHGDAQETAEAKRIIDAERLLEEGEVKCFPMMGSRAELAQLQDAKVQAVEAQMKEDDMVPRVGINKRCLLIFFGKITNKRTNER